MRKIITIGESVLDTLFLDDTPQNTFVGGRIANAAASIGITGIPVSMVSECCADHVGDMVVNFLSEHKVDTNSVDRFTDGATEVSLIFKNDGQISQVNYGKYPADRFDVVWPRIDEDDIVLFGSFYSIDGALRDRVYEMISYAAERKAILIYLPGFQHGINCRITKVMPAILENLDIADVVIANNQDINDIFPGEGAEKAFHNHLEFYCGNFLHINEDFNIQLFSKNRNSSFSNQGATPVNKLGWQAGLTAGFIYSLIYNNIVQSNIADIDAETWDSIIGKAYQFAREAAESGDNCISPAFGEKCGDELRNALTE